MRKTKYIISRNNPLIISPNLDLNSTNGIKAGGFPGTYDLNAKKELNFYLDFSISKLKWEHTYMYSGLVTCIFFF